MLEDLIDALDTGDEAAVRTQIEAAGSRDIADALAGLPLEERLQVWALLPSERQAEIVPQLDVPVLESIFSTLDDAALRDVTGHLDIDDLAVVAELLPVSVTDALFQRLDEQDRRRVEEHLGHEAGTVGRLMHTDLVTLQPEMTARTALRYLRRRGLTTQVDGVMVTDAGNRFLGKLSFADLVTAADQAGVADLMDRDAPVVSPEATETEVVERMVREQLPSVAVVAEDGTLRGRVAVREVLHLIRAHADHALMRSAGLEDQEDLFAPILPSARRRGVWLGINLLTAFLAAAVVNVFQATLEQVVALAVLMPVVASMGGIAGSQTLALVIRGIAMGNVSFANARRLLQSELSVGALNGIAWAVIVGLCTLLVFQSAWLGVVIGLALIVNIAAAALSGVLVPLTLERLGFDPALSGAVVLTTVTDVVGFATLLGLGAILLT